LKSARHAATRCQKISKTKSKGLLLREISCTLSTILQPRQSFQMHYKRRLMRARLQATNV
jgi:hypothetical protein